VSQSYACYNNNIETRLYPLESVGSNYVRFNERGDNYQLKQEVHLIAVGEKRPTLITILIRFSLFITFYLRYFINFVS